MSRFQIPKPKTVTLAVRVFFIGWILSVPMLLMRLSAGQPETKPAMIAVMSMMVAIPSVICLIFLPVWLFRNISFGKNWARTVWAVLVILSLPGNLAVRIDSVATVSVLSGLLGLIQSILFIASCILLFVPSSTPWFQSPRDDAAALSGFENELMPGRNASEVEFVPLDAEAIIEGAKMRRQSRGD